ncbi:hypothetical protein ACFL1F_00220 [Chlamydiota bacterium]
MTVTTAGEYIDAAGEIAQINKKVTIDRVQTNYDNLGIERSLREINVDAFGIRSDTKRNDIITSVLGRATDYKEVIHKTVSGEVELALTAPNGPFLYDADGNIMTELVNSEYDLTENIKRNGLEYDEYGELVSYTERKTSSDAPEKTITTIWEALSHSAARQIESFRQIIHEDGTSTGADGITRTLDRTTTLLRNMTEYDNAGFVSGFNETYTDEIGLVTLRVMDTATYTSAGLLTGQTVTETKGTITTTVNVSERYYDILGRQTGSVETHTDTLGLLTTLTANTDYNDLNQIAGVITKKLLPSGISEITEKTLIGHDITGKETVSHVTVTETGSYTDANGENVLINRKNTNDRYLTNYDGLGLTISTGDFLYKPDGVNVRTIKDMLIYTDKGKEIEKRIVTTETASGTAGCVSFGADGEAVYDISGSVQVTDKNAVYEKTTTNQWQALSFTDEGYIESYTETVVSSETPLLSITRTTTGSAYNTNGQITEYFRTENRSGSYTDTEGITHTIDAAAETTWENAVYDTNGFLTSYNATTTAANGDVTEHSWTGAEYTPHGLLVSYKENITGAAGTTYTNWEKGTYDEYDRLTGYIRTVTDPFGIEKTEHRDDMTYNNLSQLSSYRQENTEKANAVDIYGVPLTIDNRSGTRWWAGEYTSSGQIASYHEEIWNSHHEVSENHDMTNIFYDPLGIQTGWTDTVRRNGSFLDSTPTIPVTRDLDVKRTIIAEINGYDLVGRTTDITEIAHNTGTGLDHTITTNRTDITYDGAVPMTWIETRKDSGAPGLNIETRRISSVFNNKGLLTDSVDVVYSTGTDENGQPVDITVTRTNSSLTYNPLAQMTGYTLTEIDTFGVARTTIRSLIYYDKNARMEQYYDYLTNELTVGIVTTREFKNASYNPLDQIISYSITEKNGTNPAENITRLNIEYNDVGQIISYEQYRTRDGIPIKEEFWGAKYNNNGYLKKYFKKENYLGKTVTIKWYNAQYNSDGTLKKYNAEIQTEPGETVDVIFDNAVYDNGTLTSYTLNEKTDDYDRNTTITSITHDADGQITGYISDVEETRGAVVTNTYTERLNINYTTEGFVSSFTEFVTLNGVITERNWTAGSYNEMGQITSWTESVTESDITVTTIVSGADYSAEGYLVSYNGTVESSAETGWQTNTFSWTADDIDKSTGLVKKWTLTQECVSIDWTYYEKTQTVRTVEETDGNGRITEYTDVINVWDSPDGVQEVTARIIEDIDFSDGLITEFTETISALSGAAINEYTDITRENGYITGYKLEKTTTAGTITYNYHNAEYIQGKLNGYIVDFVDPTGTLVTGSFEYSDMTYTENGQLDFYIEEKTENTTSTKLIVTVTTTVPVPVKVETLTRTEWNADDMAGYDNIGRLGNYAEDVTTTITQTSLNPSFPFSNTVETSLSKAGTADSFEDNGQKIHFLADNRLLGANGIKTPGTTMYPAQISCAYRPYETLELLKDTRVKIGPKVKSTEDIDNEDVIATETERFLTTYNTVEQVSGYMEIITISGIVETANGELTEVSRIKTITKENIKYDLAGREVSFSLIEATGEGFTTKTIREITEYNELGQIDAFLQKTIDSDGLTSVEHKYGISYSIEGLESTFDYDITKLGNYKFDTGLETEVNIGQHIQRTSTTYDESGRLTGIGEERTSDAASGLTEYYTKTIDSFNNRGEADIYTETTRKTGTDRFGNKLDLETAVTKSGIEYNPFGEELAWEKETISSASAHAVTESWQAESLDEKGRITEYTHSINDPNRQTERIMRKSEITYDWQGRETASVSEITDKITQADSIILKKRTEQVKDIIRDFLGNIMRSETIINTQVLTPDGKDLLTPQRIVRLYDATGLDSAGRISGYNSALTHYDAGSETAWKVDLESVSDIVYNSLGLEEGLKSIVANITDAGRISRFSETMPSVGKIKSVSQKTTGVEKTVSAKQYDKNGRLKSITENGRYSTGMHFSTTKDGFTYDSKERVTSFSERGYTSLSGNYSFTRSAIEHNILDQITSFSEKGMRSNGGAYQMSRSGMTYNDNGNLTGYVSTEKSADGSTLIVTHKATGLTRDGRETGFIEHRTRKDCRGRSYFVDTTRTNVKYNDRGQVIMRESTTKLASGEKIDTVRNNIEYDKYGRIVKFTENSYSTKSGATKFTRIQSFNKHGQVISYTEKGKRSATGKYSQKVILRYNSKGQVKYSKTRLNDANGQRTIYKSNIKYDVYGREKEYSEKITGQGSVTLSNRHVINHYNSRNQIVKQTESGWTSTGGKYTSKIRYTYDNRTGRVTSFKSRLKDMNGTRDITKNNIKYDKNGREIGFTETVKRGRVFVSKRRVSGRVFNSRGQVIKEKEVTRLASGEVITSYKSGMTYNRSGKLIKYDDNVSSNTGTKRRYTRRQRFDAKGRLIEYRENGVQKGHGKYSQTTTFGYGKGPRVKCSDTIRTDVNGTRRIQKSNIKYDSYGREIGFDRNIFKSGNCISSGRVTNKYDKCGRIIKETQTGWRVDGGNGTYTNEYRYDSIGRIKYSKSRISNINGTKIIIKTNIKYDSAGREIGFKERTTNGEGQFVSRRTVKDITYNRKGQIIRKKDITELASGEKVTTETRDMRYDDKGNLIHFHTVENSSLSGKNEYTRDQTFNDLGQVTGFTQSGFSESSGANNFTRSSITYDTSGRMTGYTDRGHSSSQGSYDITRHSMTYDDKGRLIRFEESGYTSNQGNFSIRRENIAYNHKGQIISYYEHCHDKSGFNEYTRHSMVYNDKGQLESYQDNGYSDAEAGYIHIKSNIKYDDKGRVSEFDEWVLNIHGINEYRRIDMTYNDNSQLTGYQDQGFNDKEGGYIRKMSGMYYNENSQLEGYDLWTQNKHGIDDRHRRETRYNADCQIESYKETGYSDKEGGYITEMHSMVYDSKGRLEGYHSKTENKHGKNEFTRREIRYYEHNYKISEYKETGVTKDGKQYDTHRYNIQYGINNLMSSYHETQNMDGAVTARYVWNMQYDANENLISQEVRTDKDNFKFGGHSRYTFTYGADGILVQTRIDTNDYWVTMDKDGNQTGFGYSAQMQGYINRLRRAAQRARSAAAQKKRIAAQKMKEAKDAEARAMEEERGLEGILGQSAESLEQEAQQKLKEARQQLQNAYKAIAAAMTKIIAAKAQVSKAKNKADKEVSKAKQQIKKAKQEIEKAKEKIREASEKIAEARVQLLKAKLNLAETEDETSAAKIELKKELQEARDHLKKVRYQEVRQKYDSKTKDAKTTKTDSGIEITETTLENGITLMNFYDSETGNTRHLEFNIQGDLTSKRAETDTGEITYLEFRKPMYDNKGNMIGEMFYKEGLSRFFPPEEEEIEEFKQQEAQGNEQSETKKIERRKQEYGTITYNEDGQITSAKITRRIKGEVTSDACLSPDIEDAGQRKDSREIENYTKKIDITTVQDSSGKIIDKTVITRTSGKKVSLKAGKYFSGEVAGETSNKNYQYENGSLLPTGWTETITRDDQALETVRKGSDIKYDERGREIECYIEESEKGTIINQKGETERIDVTRKIHRFDISYDSNDRMIGYKENRWSSAESGLIECVEIAMTYNHTGQLTGFTEEVRKYGLSKPEKLDKDSELANSIKDLKSQKLTKDLVNQFILTLAKTYFSEDKDTLKEADIVCMGITTVREKITYDELGQITGHVDNITYSGGKEQKVIMRNMHYLVTGELNGYSTSTKEFEYVTKTYDEEGKVTNTESSEKAPVERSGSGKGKTKIKTSREVADYSSERIDSTTYDRLGRVAGKKGEKDGKSYVYKTKSFDRSGRATDYVEEVDGVKYQHYDIKYNACGRLIEEKINVQKEQGWSIFKTKQETLTEYKYSYDSNETRETISKNEIYDKVSSNPLGTIVKAVATVVIIAATWGAGALIVGACLAISNFAFSLLGGASLGNACFTAGISFAASCAGGFIGGAVGGGSGIASGGFTGVSGFVKEGGLTVGLIVLDLADSLLVDDTGRRLSEQIFGKEGSLLFINAISIIGGLMAGGKGTTGPPSYEIYAGLGELAVSAVLALAGDSINPHIKQLVSEFLGSFSGSWAQAVKQKDHSYALKSKTSQFVTEIKPNSTIGGVTAARVKIGTSNDKVAVIGRNMDTRVEVFAGELNAEIFEPSATARELAKAGDDFLLMRENRGWVNKLNREGYTVYDTGLDPEYTSRGNYLKGPYYEMETKEIFGD